jgi:hypothetical protein
MSLSKDQRDVVLTAGICTGLSSVLPKSMSFPEPQNMTIFGNRVFIDIIT